MSNTNKAAIYDLGYQRYSGSRLDQRSRYRVIARNQFSMAWKGLWLYKAPLFIAGTMVVGIGVAMYISRQDLVASTPAGSMIRTAADSLIPKSFAFLSAPSILVSLTLLAGAISKDLRAGAFEFFFSRPIRPIDYTLGRVSGACMLLAPILLVAPVLLTIYRISLTGDLERVLDTLPWIPKALCVGFAATITQACVALAFGAVFRSPRHAIAGYAAFALVLGSMIPIVAGLAGYPELAVLDISAAITGLASGLFGLTFIFDTPAPGLLASCVSLAGYTVISVLIILLRVGQAQRAGMGGG